MGIKSVFKSKDYISTFSDNCRSLTSASTKGEKVLNIDRTGYYVGYMPSVGMLVLLPLSNGKVFASKIESIDESKIYLEKELPESISMNIKISIFDFLSPTYYKDVLRIGNTSQRPNLEDVDEGFEYYDSILKKKILWNGSAWVNMDGSSL